MTFLRKYWAYLLIAVLILRGLAAAVAPLTDNSEGRYAVMCRNMALSGDYAEPMFFHEGVYQNFAGKPPLFFWLGAFSVKIFGSNEFAVRLPSLLTALLTVLLVYWLLKRYRSEREAAAGAFLLGTCGFFLVFAGTVITDMVLCLTISGAILSYMAFLSEREKKGRTIASLLVFLFLGFGMLAKGPVAIVLFGMPVFVWTLWNKQWKTLKDLTWVRGFLLFFLIAAPWFAVMHFRRPDFLEYFFIHENFLRFVSHEYGDRYGAGRELHYGAAVWAFAIVTLPWILLGLHVLLRKSSRPLFTDKKLFSDPITGISFFGFAIPTLFWSLTSRLTISYLLPTAPMFCVFLACCLFREKSAAERFEKPVFVLGILSAVITLLMMFLSGPAAAKKCRTGYYVTQKYFEFIHTEPALAGKKLYFIRDTPYSPDFYADGYLVHHAKEPVQDSFRKGNDCILAVSDYQFRKCKPELFSYRVLAKVGGYRLLLPVTKPERKP